MKVETINLLLTALNVEDRASMFDAIMFGQMLKHNSSYVELCNDVRTICEASFLLEISENNDNNTNELLEKASKSCREVREKFNMGYTCPEKWSLNWNEYYLLNRLVNSDVFTHILQIRDKVSKLELMFTSIDEFAKELDMERDQDAGQDRE